MWRSGETQEKGKVQVSKTFGKSSKKQEMLEIEDQNCDDTLGNEERECWAAWGYAHQLVQEKKKRGPVMKKVKIAVDEAVGE